MPVFIGWLQFATAHSDNPSRCGCFTQITRPPHFVVRDIHIHVHANKEIAVKARAAVAWEPKKPLTIEEVDVEGPREGEVLLKVVASGVCHTDAFTLSGDDPEGAFPCILGHEGGCVVVECGPGVKTLKAGDHVIPLYTPECRECKFCLSRKTNLCQSIRSTQGRGLMPDATSRFSLDGQPLFHYMGTSTFSNSFAQRPTMIPIDAKVNEVAMMKNTKSSGSNILMGVNNADASNIMIATVVPLTIAPKVNASTISVYESGAASRSAMKLRKRIKNTEYALLEYDAVIRSSAIIPGTMNAMKGMPFCTVMSLPMNSPNTIMNSSADMSGCTTSSTGKRRNLLISLESSVLKPVEFIPLTSELEVYILELLLYNVYSRHLRAFF